MLTISILFEKNSRSNGTEIPSIAIVEHVHCECALLYVAVHSASASPFLAFVHFAFLRIPLWDVGCAFAVTPGWFPTLALV